VNGDAVRRVEKEANSHRPKLHNFITSCNYRRLADENEGKQKRMKDRNPWVGLAAVAALALAAVVVAVTHTGSNDGWGMMGRHRGGYGPGMMNGGNGDYGPGTMRGYRGGYGPGMMGSGYGIPAPSSPARSASKANLKTVRERAGVWLRDRGFGGYRVAEVMAFTNNDYIAVEDSSGHGAFELLSGPRGEWLMPEPGPNMIWNTRYGMMGGSGWGMMGGSGQGMMGGYGAHNTPSEGGQNISASRARTIADKWLDKNLPGRRALDPLAFPGYYTIDFGSNGHPVGMFSVNASTGAVWYHNWHGHFLASSDGSSP
jgi:hypothetical protein